MVHDPEQVVLLADDGTSIGTADKASVHTTDTPLHLAFSCHVSDGAGRLLVTRRALGKRTWPGVWTNSFCDHPAPGEQMQEAIARRGLEELGVTLSALTLALPDFRYIATDAGGVVENEICPVYAADTVHPNPELGTNPEEVMDFAWVEWSDAAAAMTATPFAFSPWSVDQVALIGSRRRP
jgi:isopentenyl-diphosphate Delta-isomerase